MININTGQNPVDAAMAEIDFIKNFTNYLNARQPVRDGDGENGNPPKPPAYVKARRTRSKLYKNNPMTRQLRLGI